MRVIGSQPLVFVNRPFAGSLGASLYVGLSATTINYRRNRILNGARGLIANLSGKTDLGAATFPKSQAVAQVTAPISVLSYNLPPALLNASLWAQVRTFQADYENETIYRPQPLTTDISGNDATAILGTALVVLIEKRDGGAVRIQWAWTPSRTGVRPTSFVMTKVTGTGTVPTVTIPVTGERMYSITMTGLSNSVAYTFRLDAKTSSVTTTLISGIAFTGDAAGPPSVTGAAIVES